MVQGLYIFPLGGSRKGDLRTAFNLLVVWLITGFWHGVTANFILWGVILFVIIALEKFVVFKKMHPIAGKIIGRLNVFVLIPLTWVVFAISDFGLLGTYFSRLFPFFGDGIAVNKNDFKKNVGIYWVVLVPALLLLIPGIYEFWNNRRRHAKFAVIWILLFFACVYSLSNAAGNPFMYFRF